VPRTAMLRQPIECNLPIKGKHVLTRISLESMRSEACVKERPHATINSAGFMRTCPASQAGTKPAEKVQAGTLLAPCTIVSPTGNWRSVCAHQKDEGPEG
jgi:hypothetical protein